MPYGDIKGYIPENDGFKLKMGSRENFDESSNFSMKDAALLKSAPLYRELKGDQDTLPTELKEAIMKAPEPKKDSPFEKNGKDKDKFNYKSDMGKYNPTITSYEGDAFVGTTGGGQRQPKGKEVSGRTQTGNTSEDKFFRGKVIGSASSKSKQDSRVKGATYSS